MAGKKVYANINAGPLTPLFQSRLIVVITNWVFQGLLYSDSTEKIFKISLDIVLTIVLTLVMTLLFSPGYLLLYILVSLVLAHTINWVFNGQIFALLKNFNMVYNEEQRIIDYANGIKTRASREKGIEKILVYGSLVRGEIKCTSDLDLRIIRGPGIVNGFNTCVFVMLERFRAFLYRFPLDVYLLDSPKHLSKMRKDEIPYILYGSDSCDTSLDKSLMGHT